MTMIPPHPCAGAAFDPSLVDAEMVNDSLGTIDLADSTGVDDEKETGDAKRGNANTRED